MDNIEQLKQDNAKLTERLNNAAKFFREQKAQIESLTKEKEELEKKFKEQQDFEANNINKVVPELEEKLKGYENEFKSLNAVNDDLNKQCNEYELKLQKLESDIDSKDKAYKVLQDTYNELFGENTKLKKDLENRINQLKKENKELEESSNKIIDSYEKDLNTYKEKEIELTNKLDESIKNNKELQDKYDNLDKICNDFENQKLSWEGDYQGLAEMYHQLQKEYERLGNTTDMYSQSDITLTEIINLLIKKGLVNKTEILTKSSIKESGTSHRIGDNLESGKNVGV